MRTHLPVDSADQSDGGVSIITPGRMPALRDVPHPFPYQGSKRALAHVVLQFIPQDATTLVEPFSGSAAISIASKYAHIVDRAVINDVNEPLMEMWRRIISDPGGLADSYEQMWKASLGDPKSYFFEKRSEFNKNNDPALLLYLLNRIVKGAVRYSKTGEFNQSADNRRLGAKPDTVRDRLIRTSEVMQGTQVFVGSYESLLIEAGSTDVVYMDPPYQGVTNVADHRYMTGLVRDDFERVLRKANENGVSYIISYDAVREDKKYGEPLDESLGLTHLHIVAGRSAQSTLSGRDEVTVESLYLSQPLIERLGGQLALTEPADGQQALI